LYVKRKQEFENFIIQSYDFKQFSQDQDIKILSEADLSVDYNRRLMTVGINWNSFDCCSPTLIINNDPIGCFIPDDSDWVLLGRVKLIFILNTLGTTTGESVIVTPVFHSLQKVAHIAPMIFFSQELDMPQLNGNRY
jgi:hypothetical protein